MQISRKHLTAKAPMNYSYVEKLEGVENFGKERKTVREWLIEMRWPIREEFSMKAKQPPITHLL